VAIIPGVNPGNHQIEPYTGFPDVEFASKAVWFEHRLDLATEGQGGFDLCGYGAGYYVQTMNTFSKMKPGPFRSWTTLPAQLCQSTPFYLFL
jgi:hypothetical protein